VSGGEHGERHVTEAVDETLDSGSDVARYEPMSGRRGPGGTVEMVSLRCREAQSRGQRAEKLRGRVGGATLLEAHDVVDTHTRESSKLFAPKPPCAASRPSRQPDRLGTNALAPRSKHAREFTHRSIMRRFLSGSLVPAVPRPVHAWELLPDRRRMEP
jgi:hypothetical protein